MKYIYKNIDDFDENFYSKIYNKLKIKKKNKIDKLLNKKLSLLGYYELDLLLKEIDVNINIYECDINYNKYGKPSIDNIFYSISHDNKITICAVSDKPIGIDIIYLKRHNRIKIDEFAIKEAYIKMVGNSILNINKINLELINNTCNISKIFIKDYIVVICEIK